MTYVPKDREAWAAKMAAWAQRQYFIIGMREQDDMTFSQIAEHFNIKPQRARQLYIAAKHRQVREMQK